MAEDKVFKFDEFEAFRLYLQSIEWQDPCLIALIFFHVTVTLTSVLTRNHGNFQVVLFLVLLLLVYFSENLNQIAIRNADWIFRHQYVDNSGIFISLVFCAPILLNCMVLVASWLYQSNQLMGQLNRAQLQMRLRNERLRGRDGSADSQRRPGSVLVEPSMDATGIQDPRLKEE